MLPSGETGAQGCDPIGTNKYLSEHISHLSDKRPGVV